MARPHVRLAMMLVLSMMMAGCVYSSTPEWGTGDGQLKVNVEEGKANIKSNLGEGYDAEVDLIECKNSTFKITGMLITSVIYEEHPDAGGIDSAMGAAVIIDTMTWSAAESVKEGTAGRVPIKEWSSPINPTPEGGSNEIDTNADNWEVIGIIPSSENIANGLNVLDHWHQPIQLTGYIVDENGYGTVNSENCDLEEQGHAMVVTKIRAEEGTVSINGDSNDEYLLGDTDIFGRVSFILFFIVVGLGGGLGLYSVSTMVIRTGAKATAETLLGREGFAKAVQMKKDLKSSKKDGIVSAGERAVKMNKSNPPPMKKSKEESVIPGFSLDNILASVDSEEVTSSFDSGSVMVTSEAEEMPQKSVVESAPVIDNTPMPSANVVTSMPPANVATSMPSANVVTSMPEPVAKRGHFSASMSSSNIAPQQSRPAAPEKPVKRRAAKKRSVKSAPVPAPVPEPEPAPTPKNQNKTASVSDDEEFSDFSF